MIKVTKLVILKRAKENINILYFRYNQSLGKIKNVIY